MTQQQYDLFALIEDPPPPIPHPDGHGYIPAWIAEQIHEDRPSNGGSPLARFHACPNCQAIVLTGLDGHIIADMVTVDPTPLSRQGEAACILIGRETYTVWRVINGYEITDRRGPRIRQRGHAPIVPAHQCGARFPGFIAPPALPSDTDAPPPF